MLLVQCGRSMLLLFLLLNLVLVYTLFNRKYRKSFSVDVLFEICSLSSLVLRSCISSLFVLLCIYIYFFSLFFLSFLFFSYLFIIQSFLSLISFLSFSSFACFLLSRTLSPYPLVSKHHFNGISIASLITFSDNVTSMWTHDLSP